jgi:hypothetical protein
MVTQLSESFELQLLLLRNDLRCHSRLDKASRQYDRIALTAQVCFNRDIVAEFRDASIDHGVLKLSKREQR